MSVAAVAEPGVFALLIGLPAVVVVTRLLGLRRFQIFAIVQDTTPVVLLLAWVGLVVAAIARAWPLVAVAGVLAAYHVALVTRLAARNSPPRWVRSAPTTTLALANVYVDNDEFAVAARQLIEVGADVLVVVETTPAFRAAFEAEGGTERYPFRTFDADDDGEYAVSLYARSEPVEIEMIDIGELRCATARVDVGPVELQVVGAIPMAAVDPGGYEVWHRQVQSLSRFAARVDRPLVIAGDLNTTVHRAAFTELDEAGLTDAHDALGEGWRPSFKLSARGALARLGPLVRLDHALTNRWVWATEVHDLETAGSDHRPFVVTLAVRSSRNRYHRPRASSHERSGELRLSEMATGHLDPNE